MKCLLNFIVFDQILIDFINTLIKCVIALCLCVLDMEQNI